MIGRKNKTYEKIGGTEEIREKIEKHENPGKKKIWKSPGYLEISENHGIPDTRKTGELKKSVVVGSSGHMLIIRPNVDIKKKRESWKLRC